MMADKTGVSPLIVVAGETASGKSALAMELAMRFDGELICADSWTVYKGFDIGTAKSSPAERKRVPHHLLDIADPREGFSAAIFQRRAMQAIEEISARGKIAILVGGTGLYIDSVIFDYTFLPPSDASLRADLNNTSLADLLAKVDDMQLDMTSIDIRNKRRLIRHIENNGVRPTRQSLRQNTLLLGLHLSTDKLLANIERRVETMFHQGLEQEVRQLADTYGWDVEPMKGIGYQEWRAFLEGTQTLAVTQQLIVRHTLQLAKRQRTWFRRNKSIHWLTTDDKLTKSVDVVTTFLNK